MPIGAVGGGIIQGILNAGAGIVNTVAGNKANRELAEYQYSKDLEMWNKTNEYNLPTSQMKRLKDAGLNPNLVYGSGGATTQAAQMPKYNAPTMSYNYQPGIDIPAMIGQYQDIQIRNAQIDNLKAQKKAIEASAGLKEVDLLWRDDTLRNKNVQQLQSIDKGMLNYQRSEAELEAIRNKNSLFPFQLQGLEGQNRKRNQEIENLMSTKMKTEAATEYQRLMIEWYTGNAVMGMLGKGAGLVKGLFGAGAKGAKGTMNKSTREMNEWKKEFIKNYERH